MKSVDHLPLHRNALYKTQVLQLLNDVTDDASRGTAEVVAASASLAATEATAQGADTDALAEVDFVGNRGCDSRVLQ